MVMGNWIRSRADCSSSVDLVEKEYLICSVEMTAG